MGFSDVLKRVRNVFSVSLCIALIHNNLLLIMLVVEVDPLASMDLVGRLPNAIAHDELKLSTVSDTKLNDTDVAQNWIVVTSGLVVVVIVRNKLNITSREDDTSERQWSEDHVEVWSVVMQTNVLAKER